MKKPRLFSLDALRGLIIVLMALDHANHFIARQHSSGEYWGGPFPVYHDSLTFLTRLVTHLCAPGFFFLMGVGMVLWADARRKQGWSAWAIRGHFLFRGGAMILLKLLLVNRAWELGGGWGIEIYIGVLFALGGAMMLGGLIWRLDPRLLLAITLVLFLGTEALTPVPRMWGQALPALSRLLLVPGGDLALWVNYPILPWLALTTFGMALGHWLAQDSAKTLERALWLGVALLLAFVALRYLNGLGNIRPRAGNTWIDFVNVVKYPPSLTFSLMTMGVNLMLLGLLARAGKIKHYLRPLAVYGQAPLFFYVTHLFLYAALGRWLAPRGTSLPAMYPYWLLGLAMLYPLCWGYGQLKHRQPPESVLRFF